MPDPRPQSLCVRSSKITTCRQRPVFHAAGHVHQTTIPGTHHGTRDTSTFPAPIHAFPSVSFKSRQVECLGRCRVLSFWGVTCTAHPGLGKSWTQKRHMTKRLDRTLGLYQNMRDVACVASFRPAHALRFLPARRRDEHSDHSSKPRRVGVVRGPHGGMSAFGRRRPSHIGKHGFQRKNQQNPSQRSSWKGQ